MPRLLRVTKTVRYCPLTVPVLMERRWELLPCGATYAGFEGAGEAFGGKGGGWKWKSHLFVIKILLMGPARQKGSGGPNRWDQLAF